MIDNKGIQIIQAVVFQKAITVHQIRKGITRLYAVKAVLFTGLAVQVYGAVIRVNTKHFYAVDVFIVIHRNVHSVVGEQIRIHVPLAIIIEVVAQQRVQHLAGVIRRVLIVHGKGNLIHRGVVMIFLAVLRRLLAGLLVLGDDLLHADARADGLRAGRESQILDRAVNNGCRGDFAGIQLRAVRVQPLRGIDVGILNDRRGGILLIGGNEPVHQQTPRRRHHHNQEPPFFQIPQQLKILHE